MRYSILPVVFAILAPSVLAAPTPTENDAAHYAAIAKRATITDVADTGYATQNGGQVPSSKHDCVVYTNLF